jgi:hypothetical protein
MSTEKDKVSAWQAAGQQWPAKALARKALRGDGEIRRENIGALQGRRLPVSIMMQ